MARIYSADINILYRELLKTKPGMILTYSRMTRLIDITVKGSSNYILNVARKRARDEKRILFRAVNGIGLERLNDHKTVSAGRSYIDSAHRAAKAATRALLCIKKFDELEVEDIHRFNAIVSVARSIINCSNPKAFDAIEAGVAIKKMPLGIVEVARSSY